MTPSFRTDPAADAASGRPDCALAQAVASRICHDLVSPVGAVVNGVDLLAELGTAGGAEELALVGQSAARAATVLAFHRLAFGAAEADATAVARPALARTLSGMIASNRIALSVMQTEGAALPRTHARLAAVMVLASRAVLGMTGTLSLSLAADAALPIAMRAQGPDIGRKAGLVEQAAVTAPEPEPRLVEFALLLPWAAAAGAVLSVETREDSLLLRALPA